jgi:predicted Fe-S protein YdhL (DUF1289 family)
MKEAIVSPCISECGLSNNICKGCLRTRTELKDWRSKPVDDRMALMKQLRGQTSTHNCPECTGPAYCAMADGKSANLCWCMDVTRREVPSTDVCLCRKCLMEAPEYKEA